MFLFLAAQNQRFFVNQSHHFDVTYLVETVTQFNKAFLNRVLQALKKFKSRRLVIRI